MIQPDRVGGQVRQSGERQPRIAILVLGCLLTVYDRCIRTIRATWGSRPVAHADIFYVYGAQNVHIEPDMVDIERLIGQAQPVLRDHEAWVSGDIILCGAADVYAGQKDCILRKRLIAFDYLANRRTYDFVYTVCATSYVDVDVLQRYVGALPTTGVYQGPLSVDESCGYPFVSGASILLSRDIAGDLANSATAIIAANTHGRPDDVAIGHWIANNYCVESEDEICDRIATDRKATDNHTFVLPYGHGMMDFVDSPTTRHVPHEHAYHYHFHSGRMREMEDFHRRFFAA
jgi:hypothetical protein